MIMTKEEILAMEAHEWYELLDSKTQRDIRDDFEDMLLEQWYARHTVSETDDERSEWIVEYYLDR